MIPERLLAKEDEEPRKHEVEKITQFIEIVQQYRSTSGWDFRGQADMSWPLIPKAGRSEYFCKANPFRVSDEDQVSGDLSRFAFWREFAVAVRDPLPDNDFDCLAYAQHYGLATRLLDWTRNPLVALFFAVESDYEIDGAVFCHFPLWQIQGQGITLHKFKGSGRFVPPQFDRRIVAQSGVFTLHYDPRQPIKGEARPTSASRGFDINHVNLAVIKVRSPYKIELQARLAELGITRKSLFPDLEGVSAYVNWETAMDNIYRTKYVQGSVGRANW